MLTKKFKAILLCGSVILLVSWGQACTFTTPTSPTPQHSLTTAPTLTSISLTTTGALANTSTDAPLTPKPSLIPTSTSISTQLPPTETPTHISTAAPATETPTSTFTPVNQRLGWIIFSARDGNGSRDLALLSPDGGTIIEMGLSDLTNPTAPAWSFDWQKIAFIADSARGHDIYVVDAGCVDLPEGCMPHVRNLTRNQPGLYGYPAWSPDGQRIAYSFRATSDSTIPFQIWVMNADGSNKIRLTDIGGSDPDWSPDGQMIAFQSEYMATNPWGNVFIIQADGLNPRQLTEAVPDSFAPTWAPDGKKIAFVSTEGQDLTADNTFTQIYTVNIDGSNLQKVTREEFHGNWPSWSPDGARLVFEHSLGGLCVVNADGSNPMRLNGTEGGRLPAWQP